MQKDITEKALLGCLISNLDNKDSIYAYLPDINREYFLDEQNRTIYDMINHKIVLGDPIDIIILSKEYKKKHGKDIYEYLNELSDDSFTHHLIHIEEYIKYLSERSKRSKLFKLGNFLVNKCKSADIGSMLSTAESSIIDIHREQSDATIPADKIAELAISKVRHAMDKKEQDGISVGYQKVDTIIGGIQNNNLVVLAARPGQGKTTLALNIAIHVLEKAKSCLFFTYEMSPEELSIKMLSAMSGIEHSKIKYGRLQDNDFKVVMNTIDKLSKSKLYMNSSYPTISEIKSIAINSNLKTKLDLIVIDYLQLVKSDKVEKRYFNRDQEIGLITRGLKEATLKLGVPIVILAQLNRDVDKRDGNRPMLSDLRESGNIEQDADKVIFLYQKDSQDESSGITRVYIAKNRQGEVGETALHFRKECSLFYES